MRLFLLLLFAGSVAAQESAPTETYFYELLGKLAAAEGQADVAVPTVLELYRVWCAGDWHPEQDDALVLGQLTNVVVTAPNHPVLQDFLREELPGLRDKITRTGSAAERQLLGILDLLPAIRRQAANAQRVPQLDLSRLERGPAEAAAFLEKLPTSLPLSVLPELNEERENELLRAAERHEDAAVNYVAHRPDTLSIGALLNFTLQQEEFIAQRAARKVAVARLARQDSTFARLHAAKNRAAAALHQQLAGEKINPYVYQTERQKLTDGPYAEAFASAWRPSHAPNWQAVRAALQPDEAVVRIYRYVVRENARWQARIDYGAVVLRPTPRPPQFVPISGGDSLELEYYQQFQEEVFTVPTGASFGRFWGPIASELAGVRRVFYVPDGIFHRINPALLYAAAPDYFLLEKVAVTFAASLAAVTNPDLPGKDIIRALLVGNPDYGPPGTHRWAALPKTQNEVIAARKHLQNNGATATLLTAKAATPRQVQDQIPGQQLLHLATHAYFRPYAAVIGQLATAVPTATAGSYPSALNYLRDEQGRRTVADQTTYQNWLQKTDLTTYLSADSLTAYQQKLDAKAGIVLAGANASPRDGYLLRSDLARLDLAAAQMVILSACDVGRGDLNERTELGGFAQDFRAHGVRYLISSLWPVQDRAGGAFITAFYRAWLTDNLPPEQAFVAAQRELLEAGEPLYYWGGFTLTKL